MSSNTVTWLELDGRLAFLAAAQHDVLAAALPILTTDSGGYLLDLLACLQESLQIVFK